MGGWRYACAMRAYHEWLEICLCHKGMPWVVGDMSVPWVVGDMSLPRVVGDMYSLQLRTKTLDIYDFMSF